MRFVSIVCLVIFLSPLILYAQSKPPSHDIFDGLLKKHVNAGKVNYKGFQKDSVLLNTYLGLLSANPPDDRWTENERMAFWINAYNAFTIQLITRHYPVKSIKEIGSKFQIPFVNTPWDIKFITIGKEKMDLNNIEHNKLRKKFNESMIHIALVCASKSCPVLLNESYDARRLKEQLAKQARSFLSDPTRNKITDNQAELNMIFNWYGMDFNKNGGSVREFVNRYSAKKINSGVKITYLPYDWGLNE